MELRPEAFKTEIDGKAVRLFAIRNRRGLVACITNYGARVEQILVPDRNGVLDDVALGYATIEDVLRGQGSLGAFIGRYANRIAKGRFELAGKRYRLSRNDGENTVHGGRKGSRFVVFDARRLSDRRVEMTYEFRDGEEGFPGTLALRVLYSLGDDDALDLDYEARALDRPTIVNLTSHIFFNLRGAGSSTILDHMLRIDADRFTPIDAAAIPTGAISPVAGTPFDFRRPKAIGARIDDDDEQLRFGKGYDHNFVLNERGSEMAFAAEVSDPVSGRAMEVWTTEPGLQFYSGNGLAGQVPRDRGKGGVIYGPRSGFCLEPQHFPDSPNHPNFPSTVLDAGQVYRGRISYRFRCSAP